MSKGVHFVYPETGEPAGLYNQLLDAPLEDVQDAIEEFILRWPAFRQIRSAAPDRDLAVFLHRETGEIVVIRFFGSSDCPSCEAGLEPQLLDVDGVLSAVSGLPGSWCHAVDDAWWPCPRKTTEKHAELKRLRDLCLLLRDLWPVVNRERGRLIDREVAGTASDEELQRLSELQSLADRYTDFCENHG